MANQSTVRTVTYELLRSLGLTTVFGNPGSTEQTFLQDFPEDFTYVLGLQEASVIAMADAFAQVTRRPALVNVHSSAGMGNAIGNLVAAYRGNTPLIVTSGQQHRELVIGEPYLGNREAVTLPQPWVKWAYEPVRAEDVPEAFMRAYVTALQPPAGPVYLSIPLDDWKQPLSGFDRIRTFSHRATPDVARLREFADRIRASRRPAIVFGPEVDRADAWDGAVALAQKLRAAVYGAPLLDRASFPEDHPLFQGPLGMSQKDISNRLAGHDLAIVIGAEVFRYYPYVSGSYLPEGTELLQITADPAVAAAARVGDSLLGDPKIAIDLLLDMVEEGSGRTAPEPMPRPRVLPQTPNSPMTPPEVYAVLSRLRPADAVIVNESTSTMAQQLEWLPTVRTGSFFATASGGIGWGTPAAVGVALGDRERGVSRPVIGLIGDGSFQYSVQSIWTAAQHRLPIVYVVMRNHEYSILKSFALLEETPGVPGLDLPGIDIASVARGFGCNAVDVKSAEDLEREFNQALAAGTTTVIVVPTEPQKAML
ncbi:benzoylformate decarboxylase [Kitasatospora kifunensis]|uniref:Benzoylformate decarboxylase n=1 Tax=Kitasatospora kifunensis TaxID=58351 RepID=A0A7W7R9L6_KITKI|nr:benzoylformate decarboxylase [Kitasatospora kifunensis]MBB4927921.1 benzoylformate decarboxylase [Kitasatospora kifunensis]